VSELRIAVLVNALTDERPVHTTVLLARAAIRRGHRVTMLDLADLTLAADGRLWARGRLAPCAGVDGAEFLDRVRAAEPESIVVDELDVLLLRTEPSFEVEHRAWAQPIGWQFGALARERGVLVLSDPDGLALAGPDKLYTLRFPARHRPATVITTELAAVQAFRAEHPAGVVIKPLHGGAGDSVFLLRPGEPNLAQIVAAVSRRGYCVVQEFLPEIAAGSVRVFLLDGRPLTVNGRIAALQHLPSGEDIRTNHEITNRLGPAELDERVLAAVGAAGPALAADGMFLTGLDVVGDKILEVNLHSPGGLRGAERFAGADFSAAVISAIETRRLGG
jgi:glutathione synthase